MLPFKLKLKIPFYLELIILSLAGIWTQDPRPLSYDNLMFLMLPVWEAFHNCRSFQLQRSLPHQLTHFQQYSKILEGHLEPQSEDKKGYVGQMIIFTLLL